MLVLSVFPWETNKVNNAFKYQIPMRTKSSITNVAKKMALREIFGIFGDIKTVYSRIFCSQNVFICYYCLFLSFPDKNLGFHLKEEGKELLGTLMAALANNNGYYVLYPFSLSFSNNQLLFFN